MDNAEFLKMSQNIRESLTCPVCYNFGSDTTVCVNNHAVCLSCARRIEEKNQEKPCPICRARILHSEDEWTDLVRELTSGLAEVACSNWEFGCRERLSFGRVGPHELMCRHKPYSCHATAACQWKGLYENLYDHVYSAHEGLASQPLVMNDDSFCT